MIESLRAPVRARRRNSYWRLRSLKGVGYAAPTAVMVTVFFLIPLVLVFWMSLHDWKILGTPTWNFPENYKDIPNDELLKGAIGFTLKYTVITTVVLSGFAFGVTSAALVVTTGYFMRAHRSGR